MKNLFLNVMTLLFIGTSQILSAQCPDYYNVKKGVNKLENAITDFAQSEATGYTIEKYLGKIAGKAYGIWGMIAPSDLGKNADKPELANMEIGTEIFIKGFGRVDYNMMMKGIRKLEPAVEEAKRRNTISSSCYNDWKKTISLYKKAAKGMKTALSNY